MRTGGCLCHPSTAEQQRLDRQHLHDDDHPDPTTLFYTHDQLIQLRVSDQMEPVRREQRALAFRGARRQRNQVMKRMILKYRSQKKYRRKWRLHRREKKHKKNTTKTRKLLKKEEKKKEKKKKMPILKLIFQSTYYLHFQKGCFEISTSAHYHPPPPHGDWRKLASNL